MCYNILPITLLLWLWPGFILAQEVIELQNPSLEGRPSTGKVPPGWYFCGSKKGNVPDLHPGNFFQVDKQPRAGKSYVGLVALPTGNKGAIGQLLSQPMVAGQCYELSLFAARASDYVAALPTTREPINFNQPLMLELYGSTEACTNTQLLAVAGPVLYPDWILYRFQFQPANHFTHLMIRVNYQTTDKNYPGNVLLDQISALFPIDCQSSKHLVTPDTLQTVPIGSKQAWVAYVKSNAGCLEFAAGTPHLKKAAYYWQDSQFLLYGNVYLHSLALAMKYFPDQILEIVIKGESSKVRRNRKQQIRKAWKELGVSGKQVQIRTSKRKKTISRNWIENQWVRVRLK